MSDLSTISQMTPPPSPGVAERVRDWRRRRRWIKEMANAAALGRLDDILDDAALTRAELDLLMQGPGDAGRQFETLAAMASLNLDHLSPEVRREAMWKCAGCTCRAACKRWLRTGVWRGAPMRCPNAALLRH